jgi:hypothetical protein
MAAILLANKIARMSWVIMAKGQRYKEPTALAEGVMASGHVNRINRPIAGRGKNPCQPGAFHT